MINSLRYFSMSLEVNVLGCVIYPIYICVVAYDSRAAISLQGAPDNLQFRPPPVLDPLPIDITKSPNPSPPIKNSSDFGHFKIRSIWIDLFPSFVLLLLIIDYTFDTRSCDKVIFLYH